MSPPYQLFPALEPAVEAALRASIRRFGVIVAIVVDQDGRIIDGHNRARLADELGVPYERTTREVAGDDEALEIARTLNRDRRHLDPEQRRQLVADLREQGHSLRAIAGAVGVDDKTVRNDLSGADISAPGEVHGRDGKTYPANKPPAPAPAAPAADGDDDLFAPGEPEAILDELHEVHGDDIPPDALERAVEENLDSKTPWVPNKPDLGGGISHPARFSTELIPVFAHLLRTHLFPGARVLDPFAGTGRIHELHPEFATLGIELEPEWAALHERTVVGSALDLPLDDGNVDAVCTSCTYGNRLADSHDASDPERRRSYTHDLGRPLTRGNSGTMHWRDGSAGSADYRAFHEAAWAEAVRVLCPGGIFILNIKDHYRGGLLQLVPDWHTWCLGHLGLEYVTSRAVETRSLRQGANSELRSTEEIYVFMKAPAVAGGGP